MFTSLECSRAGMPRRSAIRRSFLAQLPPRGLERDRLAAEAIPALLVALRLGPLHRTEHLGLLPEQIAVDQRGDHALAVGCHGILALRDRGDAELDDQRLE